MCPEFRVEVGLVLLGGCRVVTTSVGSGFSVEVPIILGLLVGCGFVATCEGPHGLDDDVIRLGVDGK